MAIDLEDEIMQDFLVEAGEILELLNEQLVDLESQPDDSDLLNAVFRGFHTIKGGAGFLSLDNLVGVAHKSEDIFDQLRQGQRKVSPELMDVFLQVLDVLNDMFEEMRSGEEPEAAPDDLLAQLGVLAAGGELGNAAPAAAEAEVLPEPEPVKDEAPAAETAEPSDDITEEEFDELLDSLEGKKKVTPEEKPAAPAADDGDITEEEFDQLLDELHGEGGSPTADEKVEKKPEPAPDGDITEEEFDQLLDDLHGEGKHSTATDKPVEENKKVEEKPAPVEKKAEEKPAPAPQAKEKSAPKSKPKSKAKPAKEKAAPTAESTVRVETSTLDSIMNMVGELVLIRNRMANLEAQLGDEEMTKTSATLDVVTTDLQNVVMKTRMQPIKKIFGRFPRVVRDLARSLGKDIDLEMSGEDTDLDKKLVEALADPLVHLVRNSVDHGIEMPEAREAKGKPAKGTVKLGAEQEGDHILLTIKDDGAGMDPNVLRAKAVEKGMMDEDAAARLDDRECFELIFSAGFSTKTEISDVSGRGVGMDVVKTRINQLNGVVEIDSVLGVGTTLSIKLPLTLAIMPTLMVVLGDQIFALPLVNVKEIMDYVDEDTNVVDGQKVLVVRGKPLPIFNLGNWLIAPGSITENKPGHIVIVNVGTQQVGLLVDQLIGQEEVVIKPLGTMLQGTKGLAGATITGDGRISLILDVPSLIGHYASRY